MNRLGWALPLQHQTISGGEPLFHVMHVSSTRAHSGAVVTSALMEWKRWVSGSRALFYRDIRMPFLQHMNDRRSVYRDGSHRIF
jgi:hypothetical protein